MYPSSSSSSSQGSMGHSGLTRYGSAPGSFFTTTIDSVLGGVTRDFSAVGSEHAHPAAAHARYFSGGDTSSLTSESTCKSNPLSDPKDHNKSTVRCLQRSCGLNEADVDGDFSTASINLNSKFTSCGSLVRHSSSPAGFFNDLSSITPATTNTGADNGFSVTKGVAGYTAKGVSDSGHQISRLTSQLSFTGQDPLLNISEESESMADDIHIDNGRRKAAHSYATASFGMGLWDETNAIMFSASPSKRAKSINSDVRCLNPEESQFQFSLSQTALEMETMEALLQAPQDSIHCKIRAKRGCATHPRSIAERDRRTRINGKLKKLQELVPNLDKQTSYADMLDLAMQHIKGLQNQVQNLNIELENCSCGCKPTKFG